MMTIDLTVPRSWGELTQEQLRHVFTLMMRHAEDAGSWHKVAVRFILRFCGMKVITPYADGWIVKWRGREFMLDAEQLAHACGHMAWLGEMPDEPVRLDEISGHQAAYPLCAFDDMPFRDWVAAENLFQGYQHTHDDNLLRDLAAILYASEDISPSPAELMSVFYWWAALKQEAAAMFPNFYRPAPVQSASPPSYDELRRSVDSQIRALTKGDITKEQSVLDMPAVRALTELDALAKEFDDLNRKYPSKS